MTMSTIDVTVPGQTYNGTDGDENFHGVDAQGVTVYAGRGQDVFSGRFTDSSLYGQEGIERTEGLFLFNSLLDAGDSNDALSLTAQNSIVKGGYGADSLTLLGSSGYFTHDTLVDGQMGDDSIYLIGDANRVLGGGGNDTIEVLGHGNFIDGQSGDDTISFAGLTFEVHGGYGADRLILEDYYADATNVNRVDGGADDDYLKGYSNVAMQWLGDTGRDTFEVSGTQQLLDGGTGNDIFLNLYLTNSRVVAGEGDDQVSGTLFHVTLEGGAGMDVLSGTEFSDIFDRYYGGESLHDGRYDLLVSNSHIDGGAGADVLNLSGDRNVIQLGDGVDMLSLVGTDNKVLGGVDGAIIDAIVTGGSIAGGEGQDEIAVIATGGTVVRGNGGNDLISVPHIAAGASHALTLEGGAGDDTIRIYDNGYAEQNNHIKVFGGEGNDMLQLAGVSNYASGGNGDDTVILAELKDSTVYGDGGVDDFSGFGVLRSSLFGGAGDDFFHDLDVTGSLISGDRGRDIINVSAYNGTLSGGGDNDIINKLEGFGNLLDGGSGQ